MDAFTEKPDKASAERYVASGDFYWNSGIFMFKASPYLAELKQHRPDIYQACQEAVIRLTKYLILSVSTRSFHPLP